MNQQFQNILRTQPSAISGHIRYSELDDNENMYDNYSGKVSQDITDYHLSLTHPFCLLLHHLIHTAPNTHTSGGHNRDHPQGY